MPRPYRFGRDKVHPAPTLDPAVAPWSAPRGYATSIPEEVAAYKVGLPPKKAQVQQPPKSKKTVQLKTKSSINIFHRAWTSIRNHFKGVADDILPRQTTANPNGDVEMPRLLACICCLR
jgi:hypothetical protein